MTETGTPEVFTQEKCGQRSGAPALSEGGFSPVGVISVVHLVDLLPVPAPAPSTQEDCSSCFAEVKCGCETFQANEERVGVQVSLPGRRFKRMSVCDVLSVYSRGC